MKIISFLLVCFCSVVAFGQSGDPVTKVYAFEKASTPAITSRTIDENNEEKSTSRTPVSNYIFYIEHAPGKTIIPTSLWMGGKLYKAIVTQNIKTPVIRKTEGIANRWNVDTLVKKTKNPIILVTVGKELIPPTKKTIVSKDGTPVLVCIVKGKERRLQIKQIQKLSADVLQ